MKMYYTALLSPEIWWHASSEQYYCHRLLDNYINGSVSNIFTMAGLLIPLQRPIPLMSYVFSQLAMCSVFISRQALYLKNLINNY